jgi:hypothetical protein
VPEGTPTWGPEFKEYLESYTYWMNCAGHGTSLAQETNRIDIDPDLKDAWGVPAMRVTYKDHPDDMKHAQFMVDRAVEIMDAAGAVQIVPSEVGEANGGVHLLGTCRMGNDPTKSVIDKYHRTHDVRNLFLCDGSSLPTSGPRPADPDDRGPGLPRRRTHQPVRPRQRDLRSALVVAADRGVAHRARRP